MPKQGRKRSAQSPLERNEYKKIRVVVPRVDRKTAFERERVGLSPVALSRAWDSIANQVNWAKVATEAEPDISTVFRSKFHEIIYAYLEGELAKRENNQGEPSADQHKVGEEVTKLSENDGTDGETDEGYSSLEAAEADDEYNLMEYNGSDESDEGYVSC